MKIFSIKRESIHANGTHIPETFITFQNVYVTKVYLMFFKWEIKTLYSYVIASRLSYIPGASHGRYAASAEIFDRPQYDKIFLCDPKTKKYFKK